MRGGGIDGLLVERVRIAALCAAASFLLGYLVNLVLGRSPLGEALLGGFAILACLVVYGLLDHEFVQRHAAPVAVVLLAVIGWLASEILGLLGAGQGLSAGIFALTMFAVAVILPWGAGWQFLIASLYMVGLVILPNWHSLGAPGVFVSVCAVGLSTVGAGVLASQRRHAREREGESAALARQRGLLLDAARSLGAVGDSEDLESRIVELGAAVIPDTSVLLTLFDQEAMEARVAAASASCGSRAADFVGLRTPLGEQAGLMQTLLADGRAWLSTQEAVAASGLVGSVRLHAASTLVVPLRGEPGIIGHLSFNRPQAGARFAADEAELAEGLAAQATLAILNRSQIRDLQTANRIKLEFVSTMSHELRTPLHVILGYADMLEDLPADEVGSVVARVRSSAVELLEMIDAALDLNRIEAGEDAAVLENFSLDVVWGELHDAYDRLAHITEVPLRWDAEPGIEVRSDPRKLRIILRNLVNNAIKFTHEGEIRVRARADGARCVLEVSDTGIGIPDDQRETIFEMFRQVDGSDRRRYPGTGVGLYIVRQLVSQLGARLDLESAPGLGSTFRLSVPLAGA